MRYLLLTSIISLNFFNILSTSTASAEGFRHEMEKDDVTLVIEQAYSSEGISKPLVSLNGATLRSFSFTQRLSLATRVELGEELIAVLHDWEGGNDCSGHLTILSLSTEGFYQSPTLGDCTADYEFNIIKDDDLDILEIKTFQDETLSVKVGHWHYFDGNLIAK